MSQTRDCPTCLHDHASILSSPCRGCWYRSSLPGWTPIPSPTPRELIGALSKLISDSLEWMDCEDAVAKRGFAICAKQSAEKVLKMLEG